MPHSQQSDHRVLAVIRSHRFAQDEARLASQLSESFGAENTLFAMDERAGSVETADWKKTTVRADLLVPDGPLPQDWGWRCGDLCYYSARVARPDYDGYLLVESDVFARPDGFSRLRDFIAEARPVALAAELGRYPQPQKFSEHLPRVGHRRKLGCIFPLTYASAAVVDSMQALRNRLAAALKDDVTSGSYPNDEAILAAGAAENGNGQDLFNCLPDLFDPAWFHTNPPHLLEALERATAAQAPGFSHPAVCLDRVVSQLSAPVDPAAKSFKTYGRRRLRKVLKEANADERQKIEALL